VVFARLEPQEVRRFLSILQYFQLNMIALFWIPRCSLEAHLDDELSDLDTDLMVQDLKEVTIR
jgi:hypothetical protein